MTDPQLQPPRFGHDSTAEDVLAGTDLRGKLAVVTGGYSGLGLETTRALAAAGADVIVPSRRVGVAAELVGSIAQVRELDLANPSSIRRFAAGLTDDSRSVDILINGAGIMRREHTMVGPGWEAHLAVHHLGPHMLTRLCFPLLGPGSRVVGLSSAGHFLSDMRWEDPHFERTAEYDQWLAYGQSKTAVALGALYFDEELAPRGAHAFAVHPGSILTPLQREIGEDEQRRLGWIDDDGNPPIGFKTPAQGAATAVWAATSPSLDEHGGAYLQDCALAQEATSDDMLVGGTKPWAQDPAAAERLRHVSDRMTDFA